MAKYQYKWLCLLLTVAFAVTSCIKEDNGGGQIPPDGTDVTFSIKLPGVKNPGTRALAADDEERVVTADVYVFDHATGKLVDIGYGRSITEDDTDPTVIVRNFSVTLVKANNRDVMVVTNARDIINAAFPGGVPVDGTVDKDDFRKAITMTLPDDGWNSTPGSTGYVSIPMWGERKDVNIDGSTALTGANSIKITRMTARINVIINQGLVDAGKFEMTSVRLYNYNKKGLLIPDEGAAEGTWQDATPYAEIPSLPQSAGWEKGPIEYTGIQNSGQSLKGEIYLFEAEKGIAPADGNWLTNPCIVIGGKYDGGSETFYRIDIVQKENNTAKYLHILRNNSYNITITDVKGPGKPDVDEAYNTLPVNIDTEVVAWNDHDMNEHLSDGQYQLSTDVNSLLFYDEGREQTMKIFTDYPYGWKIEQSTLPAWLVGKITPDNGASGAKVEVKITPGAISDIDNTVAPGDTLKYSFWITAGSMRKQIFVEQINEPELTITVEPERLIFHRGAANAKEVIVTTYPDGLDIYLSEAGNITWLGGGFPTSGIRLPNYYFQPAPMAGSVQETLNTKVTMMVQKDGKMAWAEFTVMQIIDDILFEANTIAYAAAGGTGKAQNVYFTVNSDARWWIDSVDGPPGMVTFTGTPQEPGRDLLYEFTLSGNPTFGKRTATFYVKSDDADFTPRQFQIEQLAASPYITVSTTTVDLGNTENGTETTLSVKSNAQWTVSQTGTWTGASLDFNGAVSPYGSNSAAQEYSQDIKIKPVKFSATNGTPIAGTEYIAYINTASSNHSPAAQVNGQQVKVTRTVPGFWTVGTGGVSPNTAFKPATNINISSAVSTTLTVYANTNAKWTLTPTVSADPQISAVSQNANSWQANRTQTITIPAYNNGWGNRTVTIKATNDANTTTAQATYNQRGYYINSTGHTAPALTSAHGEGGLVRIGPNGWYPNQRVKVRIGTSTAANEGVSNEVVLGAAGSFVTATGVITTATAVADVTLQMNPSNTTPRTLYYQYATSSNGTTWTEWTNFAKVSQPANPHYTFGNTIWAKEDLSETDGSVVISNAQCITAHGSGWRLPTTAEVVTMMQTVSTPQIAKTYGFLASESSSQPSALYPTTNSTISNWQNKGWWVTESYLWSTPNGGAISNTSTWNVYVHVRCVRTP